jgi:Domain of unknown function (DUF4078)
MPTKIIYGDTVRHKAFNPDEVIIERMANIAKKRDRSATPPPESHYDADVEVRTKGTQGCRRQEEGNGSLESRMKRGSR